MYTHYFQKNDIYVHHNIYKLVKIYISMPIKFKHMFSLDEIASPLIKLLQVPLSCTYILYFISFHVLYLFIYFSFGTGYFPMIALLILCLVKNQIQLRDKEEHFYELTNLAPTTLIII